MTIPPPGHPRQLVKRRRHGWLSTDITRISGRPAKDRVRTGRDLGEIMVLSHASVYAQKGEQVVVLVDEKDGRNKAKAEQEWLCATGQPRK